MEAGDGEVDGLVDEVVDEDAGLRRLEGAFVEEGAGTLAEVARSALLRMCEDHFHRRDSIWLGGNRGEPKSRYVSGHTVSTERSPSLKRLPN